MNRGPYYFFTAADFLSCFGFFTSFLRTLLPLPMGGTFPWWCRARVDGSTRADGRGRRVMGRSRRQGTTDAPPGRTGAAQRRNGPPRPRGGGPRRRGGGREAALVPGGF